MQRDQHRLRRVLSHGGAARPVLPSQRRLVHMTQQLAAELAPRARVSAIAPAVIKTDFSRLLWEGDWGERTAKSYPMKRLGEPADIGEAALYLAAGASWMTDHIMVL